jgi:hypothetical protein
MNLDQVKRIFDENGCQKIFVKTLSANDNSKNQVYLGGSFEILNDFPIEEVVTDTSGEWVRDRLKARIRFSWITEDGEIRPAPHSQLILYPKYPEVRFSGFLKGCEGAPSVLMTERLPRRVLLLGVTRDREILGFVDSPTSEIAVQLQHEEMVEYGVFSVIQLTIGETGRSRLLIEMRRIHLLKWIDSKRLNSSGEEVPCNAPNCGGYTLEAELGIVPNGLAEPDYMGWEVKQFAVPSFERLNTSVITLMTPEPTHGIYVSSGAEAFIRKYGYPDVGGIEDRLNFGGVHRVGDIHPRTQLRLELIGFDSETSRIIDASGRIALVDAHDNEAASWSFASMLIHWNRKHNQACYVPSLSRATPTRQYCYGYRLVLGAGTDFLLFLRQMAEGNIYYDPGIKMEAASTKPRIKKRSQFRIKSEYLSTLYVNNEIIDIIEM